jgi:hypothetical protein
MLPMRCNQRESQTSSSSSSMIWDMAIRVASPPNHESRRRTSTAPHWPLQAREEDIAKYKG